MTERLSDCSSVGSKVKGLSVGDRVALEPGATCRKCDACKAGKYNVSTVRLGVRLRLIE